MHIASVIIVGMLAWWLYERQQKRIRRALADEEWRQHLREQKRLERIYSRNQDVYLKNPGGTITESKDPSRELFGFL